MKAVEVAVWKRDIDAATRKRLASEGRALPDGSYPIETQEDMHNAWTLAKSKHGDWQAALRLIAKVAKEEGWTPPGDAEKAAVPDDAPGADAVKAAKPKMACPECGAKSKAKNPFCFKCGKKMTPDKAESADKAASPADGVKDAEPTQPVSPHREPDGVAMELLEDDAHLEGANPDQHSEMSAEAAVAPPAAEAAEMGKTAGSEAASWRIREAGASWGEGLLHDFLCPAFSPDATAKSYPGQTLATVADPAEWQSKALSAAIDAPLAEAGKAQRRWQDALTIAGTDAETVTGLRWEAHKAFADANPGPATYPTPGELRPQSFRRPALSGSDQANTTAASGNSPMTITAEHISATDFTRGPLTGGQEASSEPEGDNGSQGVPAVPGRPQRTFYRNTSRDGARSAMASMHDHIAQTFPDLCPMHGPGHGGQPPAGARPVPVPGSRKGDDEPDVAKGADAEVTKAAAVKPAKMACKCGKKARPGKFCPGCGEKMPMKGGDMAAKAAGTVLQPLHMSLDSGAMLAGFEKMLAPVVADLAEARKALKDQGDLIDQMASAPDPRYAPFKAVAAGGVLPKAMQAEPAAPQQTAVEKAAGNVQATLLRDLQYQARNDPDPGKREVAWQALTEMLHMPGTGAAAR
jgi:ribosomal protein L32